jgi:hypothetical protein
VPIAEGYDLVALEVRVSAVSQVVAAFLDRSGGVVAMNDTQIRPSAHMELARCTGKFLVNATIGLPASHCPTDVRVLNFGTAFGAHLD